MSGTTPPPPPPPPEDPYGAQGMPSMPGGPYEPGGSLAPVVRPRSVELAVRLMYLGAVLSVLGGLANLFQDRTSLRATVEQSLRDAGQQVTPAVVDTSVTFALYAPVVIGLLFAGIWVLMAVLVGKGRSWARIVATILGALNILSLVAQLVGATAMTGQQGGGLGLVLSVVDLALAAAILFLLWKRESSDFFAAASGRRVG